MVCMAGSAGCSIGPIAPSAGNTALSFTYPFPLAHLSFRAGFGVRNPDLTGLNQCYFDTQAGVFVPFNQLWHAGEDWFPDSHDQPINAVANGIVKYVSPPGYSFPGAVVILEHILPDGSTVYSMYGHLDPSAVKVSVGQAVTEGQEIAARVIVQTLQDGSDNTHLHWEIRYFLDGSGITIGPNYKQTCSGEPGPGYTWPGTPDNFVSGGATYHWTNPSVFVGSHGGSAYPTGKPVSKIIKVEPAIAPPGVDTGLVVTRGQMVTITASGLAQYGEDSGSGCGTYPSYPYTDPDGNRYLDLGKTQTCPPKIDSGATSPTDPIGALLASIGTSGSWFMVGSKDTFTATESGELYLVYNDSLYSDNSQTQYYVAHITTQ
jgi:murein DD-endopeptidase MepM/ murein hydrolase activator NlpD